jgi:hypothetical protein
MAPAIDVLSYLKDSNHGWALMIDSRYTDEWSAFAPASNPSIEVLPRFFW